MSVIDEVYAYESWLRTQCDVVEEGLIEKRKRMAKDAFKFFRATCFRFARTLPKCLAQITAATKVPSVGDAHIENWGTWRDAEGRLVWGANDFDDAAVLPFTYDLVRLATSARLAPGIAGSEEGRADRILSGYLRGLEDPKPWVLDGSQSWMMALMRRPITRLGIADDAANAAVPRSKLPGHVVESLIEQLPLGTRDLVFMTRQRGGGSLGRPRYLVEGQWRGGLVCREAKALVPSAWDWAGGTTSVPGQSLLLAAGTYRSPDPFLCSKSGFMIRRIAYDSEKIDLTANDAATFGGDVLAAMGSDLAAIHLSDGVAPVILQAELRDRATGWLAGAASQVADAVNSDFHEWREHWKRG